MFLFSINYAFYVLVIKKKTFSVQFSMMTYSRAKVILRRNIEAFHMQTVKLKVKDRLEARLLLTVLTVQQLNINTRDRVKAFCHYKS